MFDIADLKTQKLFNLTVSKLSEFFRKKGFIEVHGQSHLSILAACEDPSTIGEFNYTGTNYPLPQTNQMNLELILLKNPDAPGLFVNTTSYRQEANPIPGRHDLIFPMFEFETKGTLEDLITLEHDLLDFLGFYVFTEDSGEYQRGTYAATLTKLGLEPNTEIKATDEDRIANEISPAYFLTDFPEYTSPFWNMKRHDDMTHAKKCDVILYGMETIGSAERECDPKIMRDRFETISGGEYANLLYAHFGKDRVNKELEDYFSLDFFPRVGAGIGVTRMMRALNWLQRRRKPLVNHDQ
jgi:aspartyl/asparaginyl-tRNA synthetase